MNKSVTITLTALSQIQQMLIMHPSVLDWICPDLRLLAGRISLYWRRKTGVSPVNRLTPPSSQCQLFSQSMGSSRDSWGYPHRRHRAAHVEQLHCAPPFLKSVLWLKLPFSWEKVLGLSYSVFLFWEMKMPSNSFLLTDVRGVIYWPSHVGNVASRKHEELVNSDIVHLFSNISNI